MAPCIKTNQTKPNQTKPNQIKANQSKSKQTKAKPKSNQTKSNQKDTGPRLLVEEIAEHFVVVDGERLLPDLERQVARLVVPPMFQAEPPRHQRRLVADLDGMDGKVRAPRHKGYKANNATPIQNVWSQGIQGQ